MPVDRQGRTMFINNCQRNLIVEDCTEKSEKPKEFQYKHNLVRGCVQTVQGDSRNDIFFAIRDKWWKKKMKIQA